MYRYPTKTKPKATKMPNTKTVSLHYDTFACEHCNFQRFRAITHNDTRWKKMITRLHKKKCPKTGRTKKITTWKELSTIASHNQAGYVKSGIILKGDDEHTLIPGNSKKLQTDEEKTSLPV